MDKIDLLTDVPPKYLATSPRDRMVYSPALTGELITGPRSTIELRTSIAALAGLVFAAYRARQAAELAQSWRDYRVGATVAMVNYKTGLLGYLDGYNVKPSQVGEDLNLHAEQIALAKGRRLGLNRLLGVAILADPLDMDANPEQTSTLRPCRRCVDMFTAAPEVDQNSLILGVNNDLSLCELYTFGALLDGAETEWSSLFSLATESDLEQYDRFIQPQLTTRIMRMYS